MTEKQKVNLTWRPMELSDLAACARMPLWDAKAYDTAARACVPTLWRELLLTGCVETTLVEDTDLPPGSRFLGVSFIVFLSDAFVAEAKSTLPPYINRRIVDRWRAGQSPILDTEAVRRANAGAGLNQHVFHQVYPGMLPLAPMPVMEKIIDAFLQLSRGYRIQETTIEVYGPEQLEMNRTGGYRLRNDYHAHPELLEEASRRGRMPFLMGLSREESASSIGSILSLIFNYQPPRFFFKPGEQALLRCALLGRSDEQMAADLDLSLAGVRKRWETIFERVQMSNACLFADAEDMPRGAGRGVEKRRHLLSYLRGHWEELRPILPPKKSRLSL